MDDLLSRMNCDGLVKLAQVNAKVSWFSIERVEVVAGNEARTKFSTLHHIETEMD